MKKICVLFIILVMALSFESCQPKIEDDKWRSEDFLVYDENGKPVDEDKSIFRLSNYDATFHTYRGIKIGDSVQDFLAAYTITSGAVYILDSGMPSVTNSSTDLDKLAEDYSVTGRTFMIAVLLDDALVPVKIKILDLLTPHDKLPASGYIIGIKTESGQITEIILGHAVLKELLDAVGF